MISITLQVQASDKDGGEYGVLKYSIEGDGAYPENIAKSSFTIDEDTGQILLLKVSNF